MRKHSSIRKPLIRAITRVKTANREEWRKLRSGYIGGSDAAAVVGLNPYASAYSLWAEKTGRTAGFAGNLATEAGTRTGACLNGMSLIRRPKRHLRELISTAKRAR